MSATLLVFSVLLLPLTSAIVVRFTAARYRWTASLVSSAFMLITAVLSIVLFYEQWNQQVIQWSINWFVLAGKTISAGVLLDAHALVLIGVVSTISFLVHVFSIGYMAGDKGEERYFSMLGFFTFSMLGLVIADNLLILFCFWELVGFSSYSLIGHWREKPEAAAAAKKAFVINRVADLGFVIGLLVVWAEQGSFSIEGLTSNTVASLCIFIGVMGKSAQFPFFNWLPSAMEGPTPVSALIHAATMVVAGVFLCIRVFPLFTFDILTIVIVVGSVTALLGALAALYQSDIKKVLAYSTVSQLGFMLMAIGAGAPSVALLHLFVHAFFKAGLFLGAGSVIHSLHQATHGHASFDVQDVRNIGGLRKRLPITFFCFTLCALGLVGLPLFAGFQSKDAIIVSLVNWADSSWQIIIVGVAVITAMITIVYSVRLWWSIFMSQPKKTSALTVEEVPGVMRLPLVLLSIGSLWWMVDYRPLNFDGWLLVGLGEPVEHDLLITVLSLIIVPVVTGVSLLFFYKRNDLNAVGVFRNGYYMDTMNTYVIEKPIGVLAKSSTQIDTKIIDRFLHGLAYAQVTFAFMISWIDRNVVDGTVNFVGYLSLLTGRIARSMSTGKIQGYILWSVAALIIFLFWVLF